jgi:hypothetical protein
VTKRESFDVSIENIHCGRTEAVKLLAWFMRELGGREWHL